MIFILLGALLIVAGVVVAARSNVRRGRLSQAEEPVSHEPRDTLEPTGRGGRLSFRPDMPGLMLIGLGLVLLLIGAA